MNYEVLKWGLEDLSDREAHELIWLGNSATEVSSFEEAVCQTFDDSGLSDVSEQLSLFVNHFEGGKNCSIN
jgi:hypothetical protein